MYDKIRTSETTKTMIWLYERENSMMSVRDIVEIYAKLKLFLQSLQICLTCWALDKMILVRGFLDFNIRVVEVRREGV